MAGHLQLAASAGETRSDSSAQSTIRVALADDHALMRRSLRRLLESEQDIEVIGEAGDLARAVREVNDHGAHVLVLELRLQGRASNQLIGELRERAPATQLVVLTMSDSPVFALHALAAGALGFVLKELADGELAQAVRAAASGSEYVSPRVAPRLEALRHSLTDGELTARELEVLRLIALGHTAGEIADMLHISPRTVESHRARICSKLGLTTRAELVRHALGRGLLGV